MNRKMKLVCSGITNDHYNFQFTDFEGTTRDFSLTKDEVIKVKESEWNTLPNRYQFGMIEPAIGKMVVVLYNLYDFQLLSRKSIELGED